MKKIIHQNILAAFFVMFTHKLRGIKFTTLPHTLNLMDYALNFAFYQNGPQHLTKLK